MIDLSNRPIEFRFSQLQPDNCDDKKDDSLELGTQQFL